ncbi:MAG TPA: hypothetical protein VKB65_05460 [Myxococcota bacterium]|nr:hypothetical protein [Myxococcota bacterium]
MAKAREGDEAAVGQCASCRHAFTQDGARGSVFWRCLRADRDPAYPRYPPLPVRRCAGHEPPPER